MPLNSKIDVAKVRSHLIPISGAHGRKYVPVAPNLRETIALLSSCSKNVKSQPVTSFSILGFHSGSDFPKGVTVSPCQSVLQRTLGAVVAQRQPSCVWAHGSIVFVMLWGGVLISFTIVQWARHCAKGCLILYLKNVETCGLTMSDCSHILFVWYAYHTSTSHQSLQYPGPSMRWRISTQCLMSLRS